LVSTPPTSSTVAALTPDTASGPSPTPPVAATPATQPTGPASADRPFAKVRGVTGNITPKSVAADGHGLITAQNMMYRHSVTVYEAATGKLLATIPDRVDLSQFGLGKGTITGGPVEAAMTNDGHLYVSNYEIAGSGFTHPGDDTCEPGDVIDHSFVYRIDLHSYQVDQVIAVGETPKYLALTPDGTRLLVSNWCSFDLSIIDTATAKEIARTKIGRYPRGIAITADSTTAYVAAMGTKQLAKIDVATGTRTWMPPIGSGPRHVVLSPDGTTLYVTLNAEGVVAKVDRVSGKVIGRARTGQAPRSMAVSPDGTALFIVNYESDTVSKVRTDTMAVAATRPTNDRPIGITYEATTQTVWVSCYSGVLQVFSDTP
jgi:YVTN family beta-propeller protein